MMYVPPQVNTALDLLAAAGYEAYLVGGAVRDYVRENRQGKDWDITAVRGISKRRQSDWSRILGATCLPITVHFCLCPVSVRIQQERSHPLPLACRHRQLTATFCAWSHGCVPMIPIS